MKPLVRWTIGPVQDDGFDCLWRSVVAFSSLYDVDIAICYNGMVLDPIPDCPLQLVNQADFTFGSNPLGVSWKLYPPRLALDRHELFLDNDLIVEEHIPAIDNFFASDSTLLLEADSRNYGRFEKHVPRGFNINSGLFGVPPGFDLKKYIDFYGRNWENNCPHSGFTYDEQGLVAIALLDHPHYTVISRKVVTNCELHYQPSAGMHFSTLNRSKKHLPYLRYKYRKIFL